MKSDEEWMQHAFQLAKKSEMHDEVPVGAIVVCKNKIIGEGWNQPILSNNPTAHAEIIALKEAGEKIGNYRLLESTMYVMHVLLNSFMLLKMIKQVPVVAYLILLRQISLIIV